MDDVDAVQAQIARNMLASGDWVTARLDGVAYLEKAPLIYWVIAGCYSILGVARLGGAIASCPLGHCPRIADRAFRRVGLWTARGMLCRVCAWLRAPDFFCSLASRFPT